MPPDAYEITLSLIDEATASQLPVRVGMRASSGVWPSRPGQSAWPYRSRLCRRRGCKIPVDDGAMWFGGRLQLLGRGEIVSEAPAGGRLPVSYSGTRLPGLCRLDCSWYGLCATSTIMCLTRLRLVPLSRYDTGLWRLESIREVPAQLPPNLAPGRYELIVEPRSGDGQPAEQPIG